MTDTGPNPLNARSRGLSAGARRLLAEWKTAGVVQKFGVARPGETYPQPIEREEDAS